MNLVRAYGDRSVRARFLGSDSSDGGSDGTETESGSGSEPEVSSHGGFLPALEPVSVPGDSGVSDVGGVGTPGRELVAGKSQLGLTWSKSYYRASASTTLNSSR